MENEILMLAERGFSYRLISRITKLTSSQIGYVLKKNEAKVSLYRNGQNQHAKQVLKRLRIYISSV